MAKDVNHKPKIALITGSTSGIGLGIADKFLADGYHVAFHGLEENGAEIARKYSHSFGVTPFHSNADLRDPEQIKRLVVDTQEALGEIDVLIHSAGIQFVAPIEDFPPQKWNDILAVNLSSAFHLAQAVWPSMKSKKFGRIIFISSVHGLRASEFKSAYVTSKHGLMGLMKVLALEGAPVGITANALCPGYVKTPLVEKQIQAQANAHGISEEDVISKVLLKKQAIKEFVSVESIAELAAFLASDRAEAVTGTSFTMDGGWTIQ